MKAKIQSIEQTEKAGLFSICFEGESFTEFEKFILNHKETYSRDLNVILVAINKMLKENGFLERYFRTTEGKMNDNVCALPIETGRLRLYCLRLSDSILIAGNGGVKRTRTYQGDEKLNGYVLTLQELDHAIKMALKKGQVTIESNVITNIDKKEFDL